MTNCFVVTESPQSKRLIALFNISGHPYSHLEKGTPIQSAFFRVPTQREKMKDALCEAISNFDPSVHVALRRVGESGGMFVILCSTSTERSLGDAIKEVITRWARKLKQPSLEIGVIGIGTAQASHT